MIRELRGSQTEKNLLAAFAGESQAQTRYSFFASVAKKEGFEQISSIFQQSAQEEREHAKLYFTCLQGGECEITSIYPSGQIQSTRENLNSSLLTERYLWSTLYPRYSHCAENEGFPSIATLFEQIARVEYYHDIQYSRLLENIDSNSVFARPTPQKWHCRNCGAVIEGGSAPLTCPTCNHPQAHFEILSENY